jgi:hypothetical protein
MLSPVCHLSAKTRPRFITPRRTLNMRPRRSPLRSESRRGVRARQRPGIDPTDRCQRHRAAIKRASPGVVRGERSNGRARRLTGTHRFRRCARCQVCFAGEAYFAGDSIPRAVKGDRSRPFVIAPYGASILLTGVTAAPHQPINTKANRKNRKAGAGDWTWGSMISAVLPAAAALVDPIFGRERPIVIYGSYGSR